MRDTPRPFYQRLTEGFNPPEGMIVALCKCGNNFYKSLKSDEKYCSKPCVERYAEVSDIHFKRLVKERQSE